MAGVPHDRLPAWAILAPIAAGALVAAKMAHLIPPDSGLVLSVSAIMLGLSVFSAVHHAEVLALKLGEPFGSIWAPVAQEPSVQSSIPKQAEPRKSPPEKIVQCPLIPCKATRSAAKAL